jgi:hypothetical protein
MINLFSNSSSFKEQKSKTQVDVQEKVLQKEKENVNFDVIKYQTS